MPPAQKLSITLPADMARMVREKVEGGAYASNSEVIREALRTWQEREAMKAQRVDEIRQRIAESVNDPRPSLTAKEVSKRLKTDFDNGEEHLLCHGRSIRLPDDPKSHPSAQFLRWHNEERFLG